jgi:hypothetical protein
MTTHMSRTSDDPAPDPRVRRALAAAAAPVETTRPLLGEDEALAAFRASTQRTRRTSMLSPLVSARAAVASAIGPGVLLTGGVAAAAAGVLPGAAQEAASTWLDTVGISVPSGDKADENGDRPGRSEQTPGAPGSSQQAPAEKPALPPAADHGKQVSDTAKNTTAEGTDKGKEVAGVASDGRVESGDRNSTRTPQGGEPAGDDNAEPPVPAPNSRGNDTASDASDGQQQSAGPPDHGTATADESSNGSSSAGSGNRHAGD